MGDEQSNEQATAVHDRGRPPVHRFHPADLGSHRLPWAAACISDDRLYRYALLRRWAEGPAATFVMLNPSVADATSDDATIRRCGGFARSWGCGALRVVNLYAFRSTDPRVLRTVADPVGPENDRWLTRYAMAAAVAGSPLVAAWGTHADPDRVRQVLALPGFTALHSLGITKGGHPCHPVRLPSARPLTPWPPVDVGANDPTAHVA